MQGKLRILVLVGFYSMVAYAQPSSKYWVFLSDKDSSLIVTESRFVSPHTIKHRKQLRLPVLQYSDLPVREDYVSELGNLAQKTVVVSKWLNAVSVEATEAQLKEITSLGFVKGIKEVGNTNPAYSGALSYSPENFSIALKQMEVDEFLKAGLSGEGVVIGVIDAGFFEADKSPDLYHLFRHKKFEFARDFVSPGRSALFTEQETELDFHGAVVLKNIAGYDSTTKTLSGLAVNASFVLARTDHGKNEYRGEEDLWIAAMEWMDSLGVRLINTSLGYATGFTNPAEDYKPEQMNGTSVISRAAERAVQEKGMVLVVSAGNDGNKSEWKIISTPADTKGVISVGAVKSNLWEKMGYSGIGPDFLPYIKPEVVCFSATGTSFSAPAITGFVACLMEKNPGLSPYQVKELLQQSAHLYPFPNNYVGYGVPQASRALKLLENPTTQTEHYSTVYTKKDKYEFKRGNYTDDAILVYHKKTDSQVIEQETVQYLKKRFRIKKPKEAIRTTVDLKSRVIEIFWD